MTDVVGWVEAQADSVAAYRRIMAYRRKHGSEIPQFWIEDEWRVVDPMDPKGAIEPGEPVITQRFGPGEKKCRRCHETARPNRTLCVVCAGKQKVADGRRLKLKHKGTAPYRCCIRCSTPLLVSGRRRCQPCIDADIVRRLKIRTIQRAARNRQKREDGKCYECPNQARSGRSLCQKCADKKAVAAAQKYRIQKQAKVGS